ncbi:uncharacterized protein A1O9_02592 [Exophiala aquamarina CBS 119918]|uniref:Major facilitator superfamily (MFS) profile domain-containing protein n=1 Tax=Exophiala aquamarina CBS 119918 TaxID=1182545 RepID=A0A072PNV4_9EURO|nr:uncharacterized protein A1O9_02592 [Exophiala aquamarina CBS 119918]KEF61028.1 hypothetical protein A1O9_02592 [Exophiala aquamarina CBS 119918]
MEPKNQESVHLEKTMSETKQDSVHEENAAVPDQNNVVQDWTEKEEHALVRRIDLSVFPMLCTIFAFSLLDRTNISAAYIAGLAQDLALNVGCVQGCHSRLKDANEGYFEGLAIRLLYLSSSSVGYSNLDVISKANKSTGYALFEIPSNMVIRRIGVRIWLPFLIIVWGAAVLAMGFIHSWISLTVLRAILGVFEAGRKYGILGGNVV